MFGTRDEITKLTSNGFPIQLGYVDIILLTRHRVNMSVLFRSQFCGRDAEDQRQPGYSAKPAISTGNSSQHNFSHCFNLMSTLDPTPQQSRHTYLIIAHRLQRMNPTI